LAVGIFEGLDDVRKRWQIEHSFAPAQDLSYTGKLKQQWRSAIAAIRSYGKG
jgi:glycerol kinase